MCAWLCKWERTCVHGCKQECAWGCAWGCGSARVWECACVGGSASNTAHVWPGEWVQGEHLVGIEVTLMGLKWRAWLWGDGEVLGCGPAPPKPQVGGTLPSPGAERCQDPWGRGSSRCSRGGRSRTASATSVCAATASVRGPGCVPVSLTDTAGDGPGLAHGTPGQTTAIYARAPCSGERDTVHVVKRG